MTKLFLIIPILAYGISLNAQLSTRFHADVETHYSIPINEFSNANAKSVVRYSGFPNLTLRENFHFGKVGFGLKTGLLNIGQIHRINDSIKLKQRAYVIPIGLQLNFGDVTDNFFYLGTQLNFAINYKQKTWINKTAKIKENTWFSDDVNQFNPTFFIGYNYSEQSGFQIQYQYFNFFNEKKLFNFRGVNTYIKQSNFVSLVFTTRINSKAVNEKFEHDDAKDVEILMMK